MATLTTNCKNKTALACVVTGTTEVALPNTDDSYFMVPEGVVNVDFFPAKPTTIYAENSNISKINLNLTVDHTNTPLRVTEMHFRDQALTGHILNKIQWPTSLLSLDLTRNKITQLNSSCTLPPYLQYLTLSTNKLTTFDNVKLPDTLLEINFDFNTIDTFNVDSASFDILSNASIYTDTVIQVKSCSGTKTKVKGTPFPTPSGKTQAPALTHTICVVSTPTTTAYAPTAATPSSGISPSGSQAGTTSIAPTSNDVAPLSNSSSSSSSSGSSSTGLIVGVICGGVVIVALIAFFIVHKRRRKDDDGKGVNNLTIVGETPSDNPYMKQSSLEPPATSNDSMFAYSYDIRGDPDLINFRIPKRELQNLKVCGAGGFATVYRGTFDGQVVAVKELTPGPHGRGLPPNHIQAFMNEIKLFSTLSHGNIVQFVGASWTTLNDLALITEFMSEGDLRDYLFHDFTTQSLSWYPSNAKATKLSLAMNIADAITYLHSFCPPILHRDLKSRNVLLSADLIAKLTDFGISRELTEETMTAEAGTAAWIAPEVLTNSGHYDQSADIYSFGVVLSELDTWQIPYSSTSSSQSGTSGMSSVHMTMLVAAGKLRPAFRPDCPSSIHELAQECLEMDPTKRPKASKVAYELRRFLREGF
ncbi:hypothetical protein LEN26_018807 [Aphanomyces euteiches]|nr:hypothetical protein LEN26_018807 [Aphanomyces euteiches]